MTPLHLCIPAQLITPIQHGIYFDCEKLAMKYYKYILGVHKRTSNLVVYGELGRTPIFINIVCAIIKYFKRIEDMHIESLLRQAFNTSKEIHISDKESWYTSAQFILQQLNIDINASLDEIKSTLVKRSKGLWGKQLHENAVINEGKLRTYITFKSFFKREHYLNVVKNRDIRKNFTRFRVSAHGLAIERGRYKNINPENRLCKNCQMQNIEDEIHFLIECPKYLHEHEKLLTSVYEFCKKFPPFISQEQILMVYVIRWY